MESYLNENFGGVKSKNSDEESLGKWRKLCGVVKNPKRRFRFTANISKRYEAAAMRRTNQVTNMFYICLSVCFESCLMHVWIRGENDRFIVTTTCLNLSILSLIQTYALIMIS